MNSEIFMRDEIFDLQKWLDFCGNSNLNVDSGIFKKKFYHCGRGNVWILLITDKLLTESYEVFWMESCQIFFDADNLDPVIF